MAHREDDIIQKYFAPLSLGHPAARGLADDTASIKIEGAGYRVVTTDMLVAGVHFFEDDEAQDIAFKALAVSVSDVVASGGVPDHYLLSISLNDSCDESWLKLFAAGLKGAQKKFGLCLIGGDTTHTPGPLTISVTAMGRAQRSEYTPRDGARTGDLIYVTGTIGDGYLGCALRRNVGLAERLDVSDIAKDYLIDRYLRPRPRTEMIPLVREFASASIDISDGLILDLERLVKASGCGGDIISDHVPLSDEAKGILLNNPDLRSYLLTGGDDYELLLTLAAENKAEFVALAGKMDFPVTQIGSCTDKTGTIECRTNSGDLLHFDRPGYDHFDRAPD